MANLAVTLKEEIRRLARKEIKSELSTTQKSVARYRREIAALKRQLGEQSRKIKKLQVEAGQAPAEEADENGLPEGVRFSARSIRAQRRRLGLSAEQYGKLVGVSGLTIYNWEHGKSRPRKAQFASFLAVRGIGKREAQARLEGAAPVEGEE
jgi:DNA-binding transcriptional regulator YiaG